MGGLIAGAVNSFYDLNDIWTMGVLIEFHTVKIKDTLDSGIWSHQSVFRYRSLLTSHINL